MIGYTTFTEERQIIKAVKDAVKELIIQMDASGNQETVGGTYLVLEEIMKRRATEHKIDDATYVAYFLCTGAIIPNIEAFFWRKVFENHGGRVGVQEYLYNRIFTATSDKEMVKYYQDLQKQQHPKYRIISLENALESWDWHLAKKTEGGNKL